MRTKGTRRLATKPRKKKRNDRTNHGIRNGYRSGLEANVAQQIKDQGLDVAYEDTKIKYTVPESIHSYTPDFILPNGIVIETKGRFTAKDRKKHLLIQKQYPEMDLRFVFSNANQKIYKGSPTSHKDWAEKHGFEWSHKEIPEAWFNE